MSIFNEKQRKAMTDGEYICSECGELMGRHISVSSLWSQH